MEPKAPRVLQGFTVPTGGGFLRLDLIKNNSHLCTQKGSKRIKKDQFGSTWKAREKNFYKFLETSGSFWSPGRYPRRVGLRRGRSLYLYLSNNSHGKTTLEKPLKAFNDGAFSV